MTTADWTYMAVILFCLSAAELAIGAFGLAMPLTALAIFYLAVTYGWRAAAPGGIIFAAAVDLAYGRQPWHSLPLVAMTLLLAAHWTGKAEPRAPISHAMPGAALAIAATLPALAVRAVPAPHDLETIRHAAFNLIAATAGCAVLLPLMILILDDLAATMRLKQYRDARGAAIAKR